VGELGQATWESSSVSNEDPRERAMGVGVGGRSAIVLRRLRGPIKGKGTMVRDCGLGYRREVR